MVFGPKRRVQMRFLWRVQRLLATVRHVGLVLLIQVDAVENPAVVPVRSFVYLGQRLGHDGVDVEGVCKCPSAPVRNCMGVVAASLMDVKAVLSACGLASLSVACCVLWLYSLCMMLQLCWLMFLMALCGCFSKLTHEVWRLLWQCRALAPHVSRSGFVLYVLHILGAISSCLFPWIS